MRTLVAVLLLLAFCARIAFAGEEKLIAAEAAVLRCAYAIVMREQERLPNADRLHSELAIGVEALSRARVMLGFEPDEEAVFRAASQMHAVVARHLGE